MDSVPFIGVNRHRINRDGVGVTTLAAFHGCPLSCRYCLNPACKGPVEKLPRYTPESLYERVRIDNLYFLYTGGGICFGGGEPLLRVDFIGEFRKLCVKEWKLTAETSLAVKREAVKEAAKNIDHFIVDIKDTNPEIYKRYTLRSNRQAMANLRWLLGEVGPERIMVRVPLIPKYNTAADCVRSEALLREMGVTQIDRFSYIERKRQTSK